MNRTSTVHALFFLILHSFYGSAFAHNKVVVIPLTSEVMDSGESTAEPVAGPSNIVTVAKSGGDFSDLNSALASVNNASISNPVKVVVAPGEYIVSSQLVMKEHVHIMGSGMGVTKLQFRISGASTITPSVLGEANATLSDLSLIQQTTAQYLSRVLFSCSGTCGTIHQVEFDISTNGITAPTTGVSFEDGSFMIEDSVIRSNGDATMTCGFSGLMNFAQLNRVNINSSGSAVCALIDATLVIRNSQLRGRQAIRVQDGIESQERIDVRWSELHGTVTAIDNSDSDSYESIVVLNSVLSGPELTSGPNLTCRYSTNSVGGELSQSCTEIVD